MTESNFDDAIPFAKGHGTENDFIILPDPDAALNRQSLYGNSAIDAPV